MSDETPNPPSSEIFARAVDALSRSKVSVNRVREAMGLARASYGRHLSRLRDDPDYTRQVNPEDGSEIGDLDIDCGPHCGVHMAGNHKIVGHHECRLCHGPKEETAS